MNSFINFKLNTDEGGMRTFLVNVGHVVHLSLLPLPGDYIEIDRASGDQKSVKAVRLILTMNQSTLLDELVEMEISDRIYRKLNILISTDDGNLLAGALLKNNEVLKDISIRELPTEVNPDQE